MSLTAIVAAMSEELAPLEARISPRRRHRLGACDALEGSLDGNRVVLATTGDGAIRAEAGIRALLDHLPVDRLVIAGISGALTPWLEADTIIVAREVRGGDAALPGPDRAMLERAVRDGGALGATVLSVDRILVTADSKADALAGLESEWPSAVDLESATYVRVAAERGIPYLVLRVVCDTANEDLPLDLNRCLDADGGVSRVKVMQQALRRPALMGELWGLRKRVNSAAEALARSIPGVLEGRAA